MTPKEKAKELINRYLKVLAGGMYDVRGEAKQCALICVDEGIPYTIEYQEHLVSEHRRKTYWQEVKQEILKDE